MYEFVIQFSYCNELICLNLWENVLFPILNIKSMTINNIFPAKITINNVKCLKSHRNNLNIIV